MKAESRGIVEHAPTTLSAGVELRVENDDAAPMIRGYAAVFNTDARIGGDKFGFTERIAPGAFDRAIAEKQDVRALINHNPDRVLGRTTAGTLRLYSDAKGLRVEIDPPESERGFLESMKRGDVDQMSFGFRVVRESWQDTPDGEVRTLEDLDLVDVSVVTYPAYAATEASVRAILDARSQMVDADDDLAARLADIDNLLRHAELDRLK